mgnify:CR=1 FL=1
MKVPKNIKSELVSFDSEENKIRHHIDDEFTKISRPLGKFVHISSHDKELKDLTATLASSPYDVLDNANLPGIKNILDSIVTGIDSGSVSVMISNLSSSLTPRYDPGPFDSMSSSEYLRLTRA